jgi:hypothetical protein
VEDWLVPEHSSEILFHLCSSPTSCFCVALEAVYGNLDQIDETISDTWFSFRSPISFLKVDSPQLCWWNSGFSARVTARPCFNILNEYTSFLDLET